MVRLLLDLQETRAHKEHISFFPSEFNATVQSYMHLHAVGIKHALPT